MGLKGQLFSYTVHGQIPRLAVMKYLKNLFIEQTIKSTSAKLLNFILSPVTDYYHNP